MKMTKFQIVLHILNKKQREGNSNESKWIGGEGDKLKGSWGRVRIGITQKMAGKRKKVEIH